LLYDYPNYLVENKLSAFYITCISKLLLCTRNNVLKGIALLHLALQWKRKLRRLLCVTFCSEFLRCFVS